MPSPNSSSRSARTSGGMYARYVSRARGGGGVCVYPCSSVRGTYTAMLGATRTVARVRWVWIGGR